MAVETLHHAPQRSLFDQAIDLARVNLEVVAYIVVIALSLVAHLWGLGTMAMHHDESIHAWASWKFYTGSGGFTCANGGTSQTYCYDPVYHGPSLYILTLLSFFLFGDGDAQARLPMALAGVGLAASCWWLRPYMGRRGALLAAVLLSFTPALLYFTRFARHDGLMVLWELWLIIGIFRYLDTGKAPYLYLLAASLALAIGTHELYYILLFIFGVLVLVRLIYESLPMRWLHIGVGVVLALCFVGMVLSSVLYLPLPIGDGLYIGEKLLLVFGTVLLTWMASLVWTPRRVLIPRLQQLWNEQQPTLWIAVGILAGLYLVMYTTFFAYPRGALDGLYAGLAYWLGSQQEVARGDQPWYYYLMLIGIYEPLGAVCALGAGIYLFSSRLRNAVVQWASAHRRLDRNRTASDQPPDAVDTWIDQIGDQPQAPDQPARKSGRKRVGKGRGSQQPAEVDAVAVELLGGLAGKSTALTDPTQHPAPGLPPLPTGNLFPLVLVVWYFSAIVIFSWAGEKMPWLLVHMALPGNLIAAWVLARLLDVVPSLGWAKNATDDPVASQAQDAQPTTPDERSWLRARALLVPPTLVILLVALGVAIWRFLSIDIGGQEAQTNLLQGIIPLIIAGVLIYGLLTLGQQLGSRVVFALMGLTLATLMGAYMVRASWLVVYTHPDTPIEPLIYTQTSPDVPRYVEEMHRLAINQTRNHRDSEDVAGGLSMPIVVSGVGEGSLAWPLQWYFRNFTRVAWKGSEDIRNATEQTFTVELPDGSNGLAPALMLFAPHVTEQTRGILQQHYVQPYGEQGVFNWWFPEGDKCSPNAPGYKRFYFDSLISFNKIGEEPPEGCSQVETVTSQVAPPWAPLFWPILPDNLASTFQYLLFRDLPDGLQPGSRDMQVWLRSDLVSGASGVAGAGGGSTTLRLVADQTIGQPGDLAGPAGLVVDSRGRIYVADTLNHRIQVFSGNGALLDTIGRQGSGEGEFNEPRGLAVDARDNLYVADTWNARIVKLSPNGEWLTSWGEGSEEMGEGRMATMTGATEEGNAANPLGFFGPRGIAVDELGQVYISDTGNRRIVVTSDTGDYLYQWGAEGSAPGLFNEPTSLAFDAAGRLYVADTWNGRVQVFERDADGQIPGAPLTTWSVPGWNPNTYDDPALAVDPTGQVYVSVPARRQVLALSSEGSIILRWGGAGQDLTTLNWPSSIAVGAAADPNDPRPVYVADREVGRVLRFSLPRVLPTEPASQ